MRAKKSESSVVIQAAGMGVMACAIPCARVTQLRADDMEASGVMWSVRCEAHRAVRGGA